MDWCQISIAIRKKLDEYLINKPTKKASEGKSFMKIRLYGTLDEIEEYLRKIKQSFNVVSVSKYCKDRGHSELYRVYIEVRL